MSPNTNAFLTKYKLFLLVVIVMLSITIAIICNTPPNVIASSVLQIPVDFLSPPYYGTTIISSVYDHEYPTYGSTPNSYSPDVVHYDGTRNGGGTLNSYDGHNGIDYMLRYELVRAAAPGTVQYAGWRNPGNHQASEGLYVRIHHDNGYHTIYGHMSVLRVKTNDDIFASDEFQRILGISGNTGNSTGPHLHFELEPPNDTRSVNPYGWIGGVGLDPWENWSGLTSYDVWQRYPSVTNGDVYPSGVPLAAPPIADDEPGYITIDDGSASNYVETSNCWTTDNTAGWAGDHRYHIVPGSTCVARWYFPLTHPSGYYNVFVYVPNINATADAAQYTIYHTESPSSSAAKQSERAVINQSAYPNFYHPSNWVYAGTYYFEPDTYDQEYVKLEAQPLDPVGTVSIAADAVRFAPVRYRKYIPYALLDQFFPLVVPEVPSILPGVFVSPIPGPKNPNVSPGATHSPLLVPTQP